jgi:hypothetical protein
MDEQTRLAKETEKAEAAWIDSNEKLEAAQKLQGITDS